MLEVVILFKRRVHPVKKEMAMMIMVMVMVIVIVMAMAARSYRTSECTASCTRVHRLVSAAVDV